MTTVVTLRDSNAYAIYSDGIKVIECLNPEVTFNEVIKETGLNHNVFVYEMNTLPNSTPVNGSTPDEESTEEESTETNYKNISLLKAHTDFQNKIDQFVNNNNIDFDKIKSSDDIDFDKINTSITFDVPNMGAYKNHHSVGVHMDVNPENATGLIHIGGSKDLPYSKEYVLSNYEKEEEKSIETPKPVGEVSKPNIGDLIYIEGVQGILKTVTGGVGTVSMVYTDTNSSLDIETYDEEHWPGNVEDISSKENLLIELEEIPGVYHSWNELRYKQSELQSKYGYKPACILK